MCTATIPQWDPDGYSLMTNAKMMTKAMIVGKPHPFTIGRSGGNFNFGGPKGSLLLVATSFIRLE